MITDNYKKDGHNIFIPKSKSEFEYSDGDEIEEKILSILKSSQDLSVASDELRGKIWDWASEYHFSPTRGNLLTPFNFELFPKILEVGSGCGAMTRFLGERGNQVFALEGSHKRASITAERCRELSNVQVICDNFQHFESEARFDCLSMIGVLEYSPRFFEGNDPVNSALTKAYDLLDENGMMVVAIENQLGFKYFNGCREDHLGKLFAGINNLYDQNTAITFGKKDLEARLAAAGFDRVEFVYPFPDYKLPQVLVRNEALQCESLSVGNIIGQYADRDYLDFTEKFLVEDLVWPILSRNNLVPDLANSFLVFAFKGDHSLDDITSPWLVKSYCGHRKKEYLTENSFIFKDESIVVKKDCLYTSEHVLGHEQKTQYIKHIIGETAFIDGSPYNQIWLKKLFHEDPFRDYIEYLKPWTCFLRKKIIQNRDLDSEKTKSVLPGAYLDCIPNNLIVTAGEKINYFDREWEYLEGLELEFMVFRGVMHDVMRHSYWYQKTNIFSRLPLVDWFQTVFNELGFDISGNRMLNEFLELELSIQKEINGVFEKFDGTVDLPKQLKNMKSDFSRERQRFPATGDLINTIRFMSKEHEREMLENERNTIREHYEAMSHIKKEVEAERNAIEAERNVIKAERNAIEAEKNTIEAERNTIEMEYYKVLSDWEYANRLVNDMTNGISWKIGRKITLIPRKLNSIIKSIRARSIRSKIKIRISNLISGILSIRKLFQPFFEEGMKGVRRRQAELYSERHYSDWYTRHYRLTKSDRNQIMEHIVKFKQTPLISVLMPTYNTPEKWLRLVIESVQKQLYQNWELCIVDDASPDPKVREIITQYVEADKRIKPVFRQINGHISAASNTGLEYAQGEFVALLDHDDELTEDALYCVVNEINNYPDAHLFYSDEDKIDAEGNLSGSYFKPDWNPALIYAHNFVCHLGVYRQEILKKINGFREGFEGAQDWDLCLRFIDQISPDQIRHIPKILYHWRMIPGSTGLDIKYKEYAIKTAQKTIEESLQRRGRDAEVVYHVYDEHFSAFRVKYTVKNEPLVSLIILTRDALHFLQKSVESILVKTTYGNFELIIVDNGSQEKETLEYLKKLADEGKVRIIRDDRPFNFADLNNLAVREAQGEVIGLINNDIEVIDGDWLREMVSFAVQPEVGAVGCRLLYPDNTVQHAGVLVGLGGVAGHAHKHFPAHHPGQCGRAKLVQNFTAVTAACMIIRRDVYEEIGGMDGKSFAVAFNDVDFCLKIRQAGYLIIFTPFAELYHHESASRGYEVTLPKIIRFEKEKTALVARWGDKLRIDPYYNPNLTLDREDMSLAEPPRFPKPWLDFKNHSS